MMRIGITGGIGSGKSYVCRRLEAMGYPVYDSFAPADMPPLSIRLSIPL